MYHTGFSPVDGTMSTDKSPVELSGSAVPLNLPLSLHFSHDFPGDDPALMPNNGIYMEDFVISSQANNYNM